MGSWNGTCFLSNVSIIHSDKIKLQLLLPNISPYHSDTVDIKTYDVGKHSSDLNGLTYTQNECKPLAFPITGEYNDYGSIENIENDEALEILFQVIQNLIENNQIKILPDRGYDSITTIENVSLKKDEVDKFIDMVERGRIIVINEFGIWCKLKFVMMHYDMYNSIFSLMQTVKHDYRAYKIADNIRKWEKELIEIFYDHKFPDDFKKSSKESLLKYLKVVENSEKDSVKYISAQMQFKMYLSEWCWDDFRSHEVQPFRFYVIQDIIMDCNDRKISSERLRLAGDYLIVNAYLMLMRKSWQLTSGCGSQHHNEDFVSKNTKQISKFITNYKKELKVRYEKYA